MAATEYQLGSADWSDCGSADDCTLQLQDGGLLVFATGGTKPDAASKGGLRLSDGPGGERAARIMKPGTKLWCRSLRGSMTIAVER